MNAQVIAVVNQKGGTGKSTTCANLGIGLAQAGKKVLVVDVDPQASLSISLGHSQPDDLPVTLSDLMGKVLNDQPIAPGEGILHHAEGVDLMPSNIQLSGMEVSLVNAMSRETILRQYLDTVRKQYTHTPSLSQAQRMKKLSQSGKLDEDTMLGIMSEEKKPEVDKIVLTSDTLHKYFPRSYTPKQMQDTIIKLLEQWMKKRQRSQER